MVMWAPKKGGRWCDELFSSMGAEYKDATLTYVDFSLDHDGMDMYDQRCYVLPRNF